MKYYVEPALKEQMRRDDLYIEDLAKQCGRDVSLELIRDIVDEKGAHKFFMGLDEVGIGRAADLSWKFFVNGELSIQGFNSLDETYAELKKIVSQRQRMRQLAAESDWLFVTSSCGRHHITKIHKVSEPTEFVFATSREAFEFLKKIKEMK